MRNSQISDEVFFNLSERITWYDTITLLGNGMCLEVDSLVQEQFGLSQ